MSKLFILTGLPGAGKTTIANQMLKQDKRIKYLSSDELRKKYFEYKDNHMKIFSIMDDLTLNFLKTKNDVIYDSTNLERKYRSNIYNKVKNLNRNITVINIFVHNGIKIAIQQSLLRTNRDDVNEELIKKMYKTMEIPKIGQDCDLIFIPNMKQKEVKLERFDVYDFEMKKDFYKYVKKIDKKLINKEFGEIDK